MSGCYAYDLSIPASPRGFPYHAHDNGVDVLLLSHTVVARPLTLDRHNAPSLSPLVGMKNLTLIFPLPLLVIQIEFPSILLPPNIASGSIVDITVSRNHEAEAEADKRFVALQDRIFSSFGAAEPAVPVLRCRNATQTSVVLEWEPVSLATADLVSLSLYRNGQKAGNIPRPLQMHSTKISGLAVDTEYTFHLVLRTTAGTFASAQVAVRTHKMTDLSGVTVTPGVLPAAGPCSREELARAVARVGAKMADAVRIDTTHFVTTEGRGIAWEKAVEMNIPVVRPEWVEACERSGRILGVTKFYLDAVRPPPGPSPVNGPGYNHADEDVRRGSVATTTATGSATGTGTASAPTTAPSEKALPERPTENGNSNTNGNSNGNTNTNGNGNGNGNSRDGETEERKKKDEGSVSGGESGESEEDDEGDEKEGEDEKKTNKKKAAAAVVVGGEKDKAKAVREQKVRIEDKRDTTQKLTLRPGGGAAGDNEPAIRDPNEEEDAKQGAGGTSPGDGASFQDVAL